MFVFVFSRGGLWTPTYWSEYWEHQWWIQHKIFRLLQIQVSYWLHHKWYHGCPVSSF